MNKNHLKNALLIGVSGLVLMMPAQAGTPVWTFAGVAEYPPAVTVSTKGTATIQYTVTNQSPHPHTLQMKPIRGITPSGCTAPLGHHQSCTLNLTVTGSALHGDVTGGPILCDQENSLPCYQPSQSNSLAIKLMQQSPIQQYTVTPSAEAHGSISPSTTQVVNSGTTMTFTASPDAGYGVHQWLVDGFLAQTGGTTYQLTNITANHMVNVTLGTVTLTPSVSLLALSVNCQPASACTTTQNTALTGKPRQITIQNTGLGSATNVAVNTSGLPLGTSITTNTCNGTLNAGGSCVIILTPGAIASYDLNGTACTSGTQPVGGTLTITADGGLSSQVHVDVLSYGCQYQGGFIYSIDDTTLNTGSIGGNVVSLVDQAAPSINSGSQATSVIWSSNGNGATSTDVNYTTILGIDETSTTSTPSPTSPPYPVGTPAYTACNGNLDGACDTSNIVSYYNFNRVSGGSAPTPLTYYAAGLCKATIAGYSDWYLPAICEMDAISVVTVTKCPAGTQSMLSTLSFLRGDPNGGTPSTSCIPPSGTHCLAGYYWSSTESSAFLNAAWNEYFSTSDASGPETDYEYAQFGVRCSRALIL